jgi:UDP-GlcNAc:undecaprenyl-phosphate GlcNAc-1-phosphate transferase
VGIVQAAVVFLIALALSLALTFVVRGAMRWAGVYDVPSGDRKLHGRPVAYEGGVAMHLAFVGGLLAMAVIVPDFVFQRRELTGILIGATLATCVGVADDLLDLKPVAKLIAQAALGVLMYHYGFRVERLTNPLGPELTPPWWLSLSGTMLWYALLMNGINMIDGMDGLAAGIVAISGLTLAAIAADLGQPLAMALALVTAAVCLGFLPFNFPPATIFMGDAGSLLLGFLLASVSLLSSTKTPAVLALLIPVMAVGLPLFETLFAFVRRAVKGQHPFRGDSRHLHHRFLNLGFSPRRTVFIFYYFSLLLGVTAFVLQRLEPVATMALVAALSTGLLVLLESLRFLERQPRGSPLRPQSGENTQNTEHPGAEE